MSHHLTSIRARGLSTRTAIHRRAVTGLIAVLIPLALAACSEDAQEPMQERLPRETYASGATVCDLGPAERFASYLDVPVERMYVDSFVDSRGSGTITCELSNAYDPEAPSLLLQVNAKRLTPVTDVELYLERPTGARPLPSDVLAQGYYTGDTAVFRTVCKREPFFGFISTSFGSKSDPQLMLDSTRGMVRQLTESPACQRPPQPTGVRSTAAHP